MYILLATVKNILKYCFHYLALCVYKYLAKRVSVCTAANPCLPFEYGLRSLQYHSSAYRLFIIHIYRWVFYVKYLRLNCNVSSIFLCKNFNRIAVLNAKSSEEFSNLIIYKNRTCICYRYI